MLKGVIFDMDGVLVNSEPLHYKAYNMVTEEMGFPFPYEEYKQFIGSTNAKVLEYLESNFNITLSKVEILERVSQKKQMLIETEGYEKIPGIPELVKELYDHGLKLAVASSSPLENIIKNTKALRIDKYFERFVTGEDVKNPKPAPDVFLKALGELGLSKEECIIIEDSENGVRAAKAAGVTCIGFANPDSGNQNLSEAFYVVEGFLEVGYDFVNKVYQRSKSIPWTIAKTDRLIIREMTTGDLDELYKIYEEPSVTAYMENLYEDKEKELEFLKSYIENMYGFYEYGLWAVTLKESGKLIGRAGLSNRNINGNLELELGYVIGVPYQRKGYGTEACKAILKYAHNKLECEYINCYIKKGNKPSISFIEKLGFRFIEEVHLPEEILLKYVKDSK